MPPTFLFYSTNEGVSCGENLSVAEVESICFPLVNMLLGNNKANIPKLMFDVQ